jgi:hypothetical protein
MTTMTAGHETCHHRMYGLACVHYEALLARAAGRCELCSIPASAVYRGKLVIDHEGRIGWHAIRGLLCQRCNAHMRRIDSGERPIDRQVFDYLDLAGHFVPQGEDFRWSGSSADARASILDKLVTSAGVVPGARRAKPRLACAPRAVNVPW